MMQITPDVRVSDYDEFQYVVEVRGQSKKTGERWYITAFVGSVKSLPVIVLRTVQGLAAERARQVASDEFDAAGHAEILLTLPPKTAKPKRDAVHMGSSV